MNSTEVETSTTAINRKIKVLDSSFKEISQRAKAFGETTETLQKKQDILTKKINLQTSTVEKLKKQYEKTAEETGENSKQTEKLAIRYNNAVNKLTSFEGRLKAVNKTLDTNTNKTILAQQRLKAFGDKASTIGQNMSTLGGGLMKVGGSITALAGASTSMYMSLEDNMSKVSTIVDTNRFSMKKMEKGVINLSNKYGKASKGISNALYETLSAGVKTGKSMKFLDDAMRTSVTGFTDATTSVNTLTNIMNAYDIEVEKASEVSDKLLVLQKFGKTTIGEFGDSIGRVAPLSSKANISIGELFGSIATLTKNSIKSDEAITGMKAIISNIIKPSAEATKEAERLGLQFNASALKGKGFAGFLKEVMKKTHGNTESMTKLFGSVQALNSIMVLTSSKGSKDFKQALKEIENSSGMTDQAMGKMDNKAFKIRQSIQRMKNAFVLFGKAVEPIITNLLRVFTPIVSLLGKLNPGVLQLITLLGIVTFFIGGIMKMFGGLAGGISAITTALPSMEMGFGRIALIIGIVIVSLTALLALIVVLTGKADDVGKVGEGIKQSVNASTQNIEQPNIPKYAVGTNYVQQDQVALIHEGEAIVPKQSNPFNPDATNPFTNNSGGGGDTYNINLSIQASDLQEISDILNLFKQLKKTKRQGVGIVAT